MGAGTAAACTIQALGFSERRYVKREKYMNLTRAIFLALAVLVPTSWTIAKAEDAPAADAPAKKEKKAKKKKADKDEKKDDKKAM
jgi:hypothetical protein